MDELERVDALLDLRRRVEAALRHSADPSRLEGLLGELARAADEGSEHFLFANRQLGEHLLESDPWRAALHLRRVIQHDPRDDVAQALMGLSQAILGHYRIAVKAFRQALEAAPDTPWYLHNIGHILDIALSQPEEAIRFLEEAVRLEPDHDEMLGSLAHCLGRLGRLNEAEAMARRAIAGKPRSEAHRAMLAWILEGAPPRGIAVEPRDREPTEPSADPPARRPTRQRVREAFEAGMREAGYSALELERAKALWTDFSHDREILALKPETYAAAVQYAIAIVLRRSGETQAVVARRYGVATTSVCSRFGEIREALSLRPGDPRYAAK